MKYAIVGVGGRSRMYYRAITTTYRATTQLVGFCDINQTRMDYANKIITQELDGKPVPTYPISQFDQMIAETKPDVVIVTSIDRTHHKYITRAMELGCDGVLMNTAIAAAQNPILMASAMKKAVEAGREAFLAGRMPRKLYANASSPIDGTFF